MAFQIKQNDTRPKYRATLVEDPQIGGGTPVDLTDATGIKFIMAQAPNPPVIDQPADFIDKPNGVVEYEWVTGDTDLSAGEYAVEWEVTWSDGGVQTFPNADYGSIEIVGELE